jgi:hypothetical protein
VITDAPSANTSLTIDGETNRIEHYGGDENAPITLHKIKDRIDLVANTEQWTGAPIEIWVDVGEWQFDRY